MSSVDDQKQKKPEQGRGRQLSDRDRDAFLGWLAEEPEPKGALREAMQAHAVLIDQTEIRLPPERWEAFCQLLDKPPRNSEGLRRLFAEKAPWE